MEDIQAAVFERMRQAVGRLVRDGAGDALNGEIVLTVRDGQLVDVRLPEVATVLKAEPGHTVIAPSEAAGQAAGDALVDALKKQRKPKA